MFNQQGRHCPPPLGGAAPSCAGRRCASCRFSCVGHLPGGLPPALTPSSSKFPPMLMALPGFSFSPGLKFQDELRVVHGLPISSSLEDDFVLVASFSRCKFKLNPLSVGRILQASIGGNASYFKVSVLSDRVFKFLLACKGTGLLVQRLSYFECDQYKVCFHLWGDGGPD